jgi:hypothetical protein
MQNLRFSEIIATEASHMGCVVEGISGHNIENLSFSNIKMSFKGGGVSDDVIRTFDERPSAYPECNMFAERLPAYGIYFWHVKGLQLINMDLTTREMDQRNAIIFENVLDITLNGKPYTY